MKYQLTDIIKDDDSLTWINESYRCFVKNETISIQSLKVRVYPKVSRNFRPEKQNWRIISSSGKLTLLGIYLIDPVNPIFKNMEKVINAIKTILIENPETQDLSTAYLAESTKLQTDQLSFYLSKLNELGHFHSGYSSTSEDKILSISIRDDVIDEYLRFSTLENIFETLCDEVLKEVKNSERNNIGDQPSPYYYNKFNFESTLPSINSNYSIPNKAFIIMPMSKTNHELVDIHNTIKECCLNFDIIANRVDEFEHSEMITKYILNEIRSAQFLIADVTGERPNVYYEIGYAHAIGKHPILIRKANTILHFDLSGYNIPEYNNMTELRDILNKRFENITGKQFTKKI